MMGRVGYGVGDWLMMHDNVLGLLDDHSHQHVDLEGDQPQPSLSAASDRFILVAEIHLLTLLTTDKSLIDYRLYIVMACRCLSLLPDPTPQ